MSRAYSETQLSVLAFFAASIWGLYWVPLRLIESWGVEEAWAAAIFNACPLVVLLPYVFWKWNDVSQGWRSNLLAGVLIGAAFSCYAIGIVASSVIRATMLFYLVPVWSTLIGWAFLGEELLKSRILAVILGLAGLWFLLSGGGKDSPPLNYADGLAFLSGMFWAVASTQLKLKPGLPVIGTITFALVSSGVIMTVAGLSFMAAPFPDAETFSTVLLFSVPIGFLLLVPSFGGIIWVAQYLFPGRLGILMMSEVLVAVLTAAIFLPEERLGLIQWFGCALIICACLAEVLGGEPQER